jgi:hypothetical protein
MVDEEQSLHWKSILWSAFLMMVLPILYNIIATIVYGFVVGFQSRGDQEIIAERQLAFVASAAYQWSIYLVTALVILWRSYKLARKSPNRPEINVAIAVALGLAGRLTLLVVLPTSGQENQVFQPMLLVELLLYAAAAYAGLFLGSDKAVSNSNSNSTASHV